MLRRRCNIYDDYLTQMHSHSVYVGDILCSRLSGTIKVSVNLIIRHTCQMFRHEFTLLKSISLVVIASLFTKHLFHNKLLRGVLLNFCYQGGSGKRI